MYIQVVSDLHLNCNNQYSSNHYLEYNGDILVLNGDICSLYHYEELVKFISEIHTKYKHIIYVPGNHEYYKPKNVESICFTRLYQRLDNLSNKFNNLSVLDNNSIVINDTLFSGCTLWSHSYYPLPPFVRISGMNQQIYNKKNSSSINFLKKSINYANNNNLKHVIITHYPPSKICEKSKNKYDKYKSLYYNNLDFLFSNELTWIYGHTHYNIDTIVDNTRLVSNQYGKKGKYGNSYDKSFIIDTTQVRLNSLHLPTDLLR